MRRVRSVIPRGDHAHGISEAIDVVKAAVALRFERWLVAGAEQGTPLHAELNALLEVEQALRKRHFAAMMAEHPCESVR